MSMNLPNKLTILRIILIPFFVFFMVTSFVPYSNIIGTLIFIVASITDTLDGKIARKYNLITNFGKFMDPLADKMLVSSAFICLVDIHRIPSWIVIIIIAREFLISGFRLVASDNGIVIAASYWGKFKTTFQMLAIIMLCFNFNSDGSMPFVYYIEQILIYVALFLTIISAVDYMVKNIDVLKEGDN